MAELQWVIEVKCINALLAEINELEKTKTDLSSEELNEYIEIIDNRDFVKIRILRTGELVNVDVPDRILTPSEVHELIIDLQGVKHKMEELRIK